MGKINISGWGENQWTKRKIIFGSIARIEIINFCCREKILTRHINKTENWCVDNVNVDDDDDNDDDNDDGDKVNEEK